MGKGVILKLKDFYNMAKELRKCRADKKELLADIRFYEEQIKQYNLHRQIKNDLATTKKG